MSQAFKANCSEIEQFNRNCGRTSCSGRRLGTAVFDSRDAAGAEGGRYSLNGDTLS